MFPAELTHYPAWVLWRFETVPGRMKPTKVPYSAISGGKADVTIPQTWTTYSQACKYFNAHPGFDGIGFVLSPGDPYTMIDVDDPDTDEKAQSAAFNVLESFKDTYIERSPSGRGYRIIVRGKIPQGRRRTPIEMYSTERYMTITGNTVCDNQIIYKDYDLANLWWELRGKENDNAIEFKGDVETYRDDEIYDMGCRAEGESGSQGVKFANLFRGEWAKHYNSQSQADFALINMLSFYSRNGEQIKRMFYASELGKRPKAHRTSSSPGKLSYVDEMIQRSFDQMTPNIDITQLMTKLEKQLHEMKEKETANPTPMLGHDWTLPPGLMGEIAEYLYQSAPRPVKEIALAAAWALMAGVAGRAYNYSNTGLNSYIMVIAPTGTGKELMKSGVSRLLKAIADPDRDKPITVAQSFLGPAKIASSQALIKYMQKNQCFVSIVGEFGMTLQQICGPYANNSQQGLYQDILDFYNKSGIDDTFQPTIAADKEKTTEAIYSPSLTILGETAPASYYPNLEESMISKGLIPRFTCIEYRGKRVANNKAASKIKPSESLIRKLSTLMETSLQLQNNKRAIEVKITPEAETMLDEFDRYCDQRHADADNEASQNLWSRAHVKVFKLAALIAVGCNDKFPEMEPDHIVWARHVIESDTINQITRFSEGQIGLASNEAAQQHAIVQIIKDYLLRPYNETLKESYGVKEEFHRDRVVSWSYLQKRLVQHPAFNKDRLGSTSALRRAVENFMAEGALMKMTGAEMQSRYKSTATAYYVCDLSRFAKL